MNAILVTFGEMRPDIKPESFEFGYDAVPTYYQPTSIERAGNSSNLLDGTLPRPSAPRLTFITPCRLYVFDIPMPSRMFDSLDWSHFRYVSNVVPACNILVTKNVSSLLVRHSKTSKSEVGIDKPASSDYDLSWLPSLSSFCKFDFFTTVGSH